jgi:hypothetical protein
MNNANEGKTADNPNLKEVKSINSGCPYCEGPMTESGQFKHRDDCPFNK